MRVESQLITSVTHVGVREKCDMTAHVCVCVSASESCSAKLANTQHTHSPDN